MQELDSYSMNIVVTAAAVVVGVQHNWSSRAQQDEAMHNSTQYFATSSNERHCLLDQIMNHKEDGSRDRKETQSGFVATDVLCHSPIPVFFSLSPFRVTLTRKIDLLLGQQIHHTKSYCNLLHVTHGIYR